MRCVALPSLGLLTYILHRYIADVTSLHASSPCSPGHFVHPSAKYIWAAAIYYNVTRCPADVQTHGGRAETPCNTVASAQRARHEEGKELSGEAKARKPDALQLCEQSLLDTDVHEDACACSVSVACSWWQGTEKVKTPAAAHLHEALIYSRPDVVQLCKNGMFDDVNDNLCAKDVGAAPQQLKAGCGGAAVVHLLHRHKHHGQQQVEALCDILAHQNEQLGRVETLEYGSCKPDAGSHKACCTYQRASSEGPATTYPRHSGKELWMRMPGPSPIKISSVGTLESANYKSAGPKPAQCILPLCKHVLAHHAGRHDLLTAGL